MSSRLIEALATTDELSAIFSDDALLQAVLNVEGALANVEGRLGVIPARAAAVISTATAAGVRTIDPAAVAREAQASGTPILAIVKALAERVRALDPAAASFVHWGATSQDISDTTMILQLSRARAAIATDHDRVERALIELSDRHASTIMLGRTMLQPAPPITFGLKAAGWYAAVRRGWQRFTAACDDGLVLQFGGATGTLAALGDRGTKVAAALATELGLRNPGAPWHAHRDNVAAIVTSCGIYTGTLGKIARDIALLMQAEVGEAAEPGGPSSSMPHKRNPAGCARVAAAATRLPGLVAAFLNGMAHEHERAVGGWHAEWPTMAAVVQTTGAAVAAAAQVLEGLSVDPGRMRANLESNSVVFAERAVTLLARALPRDRAEKLVAAAVERSRRTGQSLSATLGEMPDVAGALTADDLQSLTRPESYLGEAEAFRRRLLERE